METITYLLILIGVLFYPPAVLAIESYKACMRKKKLSAYEYILCCLPLVNLIVMRKAFYGTAKIIYTSLGLIVAGIIYRALAILVLYSNGWIVLTSSVVMMATMVLIWLVSAYTFYDIAVCVRQGTFIKLFCIFLPPLGAYLASKAVRPYMKSVKEELDGTFKQ